MLPTYGLSLLYQYSRNTYQRVLCTLYIVNHSGMHSFMKKLLDINLIQCIIMNITSEFL